MLEGDTEYEASEGGDDIGPDSSSDERSSEEEPDEKPNHRKIPLISDTMSKLNKDMSFEDLLKMRDRIGTKKFNKEILNNNRKTLNAKKQDYKRENKNRPQEMSSKVKVSSIRQVVHVPKEGTTVRDPRFDDLCGSEYNEEVFDKRFFFLKDIQTRETKSLQKQVKKSKNERQKKKLKYLLNRMKQQEAAKQQRTENREVEREWKKKERTKVEQGIKKPFFLKRSAKKQMIMDLKNEKLKEKGTLNKVEARREKKKKSKESKIMPYERRSMTT